MVERKDRGYTGAVGVFCLTFCDSKRSLKNISIVKPGICLCNGKVTVQKTEAREVKSWLSLYLAIDSSTGFPEKLARFRDKVNSKACSHEISEENKDSGVKWTSGHVCDILAKNFPHFAHVIKLFTILS